MGATFSKSLKCTRTMIDVHRLLYFNLYMMMIFNLLLYTCITFIEILLAQL